MEGSEAGSVHEEEYTTALPAFSSKEGKDKERKDRGFRGVLPFQRKRKDKDKDKDKEKDKGKDRDRSADQDDRSGSALGVYGETTLRSRGTLRDRDRDRDRDDRGPRDEKKDEDF